ncbi:hypothetical protein Acr_00g0075210 [Actinidia rufa]|uniref:Uncharacterized protein n=1 Tax=Actinidia rufa TaxID=165716 RepID=A0A7J0DSK9_9ERIC|nr:hypothetical protein Acr_00g0075210 [Actinidia rufa]
MHQLKLPFSALDLLHVYTMVRSKKESGTYLLKDFNELFKKRFEQCRDAIQNLNNSVKLLTLRIEGQAPSQQELSSEGFNIELDNYVAVASDLNLNEGNTSSSSSFVSSNSSDSEEEEMEEVNQLVLKRRKGIINPSITPTTPIMTLVVPILVSS